MGENVSFTHTLRSVPVTARRSATEVAVAESAPFFSHSAIVPWNLTSLRSSSAIRSSLAWAIGSIAAIGFGVSDIVYLSCSVCPNYRDFTRPDDWCQIRLVLLTKLLIWSPGTTLPPCQLFPERAPPQARLAVVVWRPSACPLIRDFNSSALA